MKPKDKKLLLNDLCARLPYGVKVGTLDNDGSLGNIWDVLWYNTFTEDIKLINSIEDADKIIDVSEIKPYLFPLSSMTEEQCYKLASIRSGFQDCWKYIKTPIPLSICNFEQIDWFHKNHFDYRGLIEKGLALDATNLEIY